MGLSFSCGKETNVPEPRVEAFIRWGNKLESNGNLTGAIKAYKKGKAVCSNRLVLGDIDNKISECRRLLERQKNKDVKKRQPRSSILTKGFREHFLKFQSSLKKLEFRQANNEIDIILSTTDFPTIKSLSTYFQATIGGIVCSVEQFRSYDMEQEYYLKDNILLLARNLAFVSFTRHTNLGIKIDKEGMNNMSSTITSHVKYFKKQEGKALSYTMLLFHLSYIQDILESMATTETFSDKMQLGSAVKDVAVDCISLNFSGALKHVMKATGKGILVIAKERIKGKMAETNIDYLIKFKAVANLAKEAESRKGNEFNINREERKSSTGSNYSNISTLCTIDSVGELEGIDGNGRKESKERMPSITEKELATNANVLTTDVNKKSDNNDNNSMFASL
jgi:hypothetical protein